jgi:hypothetical protein
MSPLDVRESPAGSEGDTVKPVAGPPVKPFGLLAVIPVPIAYVGASAS